MVIELKKKKKKHSGYRPRFISWPHLLLFTWFWVSYTYDLVFFKTSVLIKVPLAAERINLHTKEINTKKCISHFCEAQPHTE